MYGASQFLHSKHSCHPLAKAETHFLDVFILAIKYHDSPAKRSKSTPQQLMDHDEMRLPMLERLFVVSGNKVHLCFLQKRLDIVRKRAQDRGPRHGIKVRLRQMRCYAVACNGKYLYVLKKSHQDVMWLRYVNSKCTAAQILHTKLPQESLSYLTSTYGNPIPAINI